MRSGPAETPSCSPGVSNLNICRQLLSSSLTQLGVCAGLERRYFASLSRPATTASLRRFGEPLGRPARSICYVCGLTDRATPLSTAPTAARSYTFLKGRWLSASLRSAKNASAQWEELQSCRRSTHADGRQLEQESEVVPPTGRVVRERAVGMWGERYQLRRKLKHVAAALTGKSRRLGMAPDEARATRPQPR